MRRELAAMQGEAAAMLGQVQDTLPFDAPLFRALCGHLMGVGVGLRCFHAAIEEVPATSHSL